MRLAIWAWNPTRDGAPPLKINLELDKYEPLPTCNKDNQEIIEYKVLPLTRARDFLKSITSFVGLIKPFSNPDLSLYYTLTRNRDNEPENSENHKLGERTLYITVFDHKERTTRVYTRDDHAETFYSTKSDAPLVDVGHFILEVEIDAKIDFKGDPVCSDSNNLDSLRNHHRSILEHIQYRLGAGDVTKTYAIENSWTMKAEDTISTLYRLRGRNGEAVAVKGREEERTYELVASDYFMHSSIERQRRLLDERRGEWIARRMEMIAKETKERLLGTGVEFRVDKQAVENLKKPATISLEDVLGKEQYFMELLLVCEVREWEKLFWIKFKAFLVKIGKYRLEEKERLAREWRANCWRRLNPQMDAALKRLANVDDMEDKDLFLESLGRQWALSISLLFDGADNRNIISLSEFRGEIGDTLVDGEMHLRMEKELEDTEFPESLRFGKSERPSIRRSICPSFSHFRERHVYSAFPKQALPAQSTPTPPTVPNTPCATHPAESASPSLSCELIPSLRFCYHLLLIGLHSFHMQLKMAHPYPPLVLVYQQTIMPHTPIICHVPNFQPCVQPCITRSRRLYVYKLW